MTTDTDDAAMLAQRARDRTGRPLADRLAGEWLLSYTIASMGGDQPDVLTYSHTDMRAAFLAGRASR